MAIIEPEAGSGHQDSPVGGVFGGDWDRAEEKENSEEVKEGRHWGNYNMVCDGEERE